MPWLKRKLSSIFRKERSAGYEAFKASNQFDVKPLLHGDAADETLHHRVWAKPTTYPFQRGQSDLNPQQSAQSWEVWEPARPMNSAPSAALPDRKRPPCPRTKFGFYLLTGLFF